MSAGYLLVESRCTAESPDVAAFVALAEGLADAGHPVDLVLVQNGVLMARAGAEAPLAGLLRRPTATVRADDHALHVRGTDVADLAPGVRPVTADELVVLVMTADRTPVWH